jgi:MFS family permease
MIPARILPILIFSQFAGTSLWFAGNAVISDLQIIWGLDSASMGYVTSSVQFGFISGTLIFAYFTIADIFSPRKVFFYCSILGAISNLSIYLLGHDLLSLLTFRFLTGFFLAGIYPVGMKIASGWYKEGLGQALGLIVGALVIGTAFPHLLKSAGNLFEWEDIVIFVSALCISGGVLLFIFVPDGPYIYRGTKFDYKAIYYIFSSRDLRASAFGYFGHMWELYTMWAFIPVFLKQYSIHTQTTLNVPLISFLFIVSGALGCMGGGILSKRFGSTSVAHYQLMISGTCCLLSPLVPTFPFIIFLLVLILWGITIAGDSPQFSTLIALTAPKEYVGSALTIVTCIGFFITIISIETLNYLFSYIDNQYIFLLLFPGPLFGLLGFRPLYKRS